MKYLEIQQSAWPDQEPLVIQLIGNFDECDKKIIAITIDFLEQFHQIKIHLEEKIIMMDDLKSMHFQRLEKESDFLDKLKELTDNFFPRKGGQYEASIATDLLVSELLPKIESAIGSPCKLIACTSEDLFTFDYNFVFGAALPMQRIGIWSNSRFGDPKKSPIDFQKCLLRMMKIFAHEFGHMRGLTHCTDYKCNIGGYINLTELDSSPLIYCLQDSAKICSLGETSLKKYHENLLAYFVNFNDKFALSCDLSYEIDTLKQRIAAL